MDLPNQKNKIEELRKLQNSFREKFAVIKKAKAVLLKLFRQKLEEKKIEEVRRSLSENNHQ